MSLNLCYLISLTCLALKGNQYGYQYGKISFTKYLW
ncbi:MAG: hypothetical protein ACI971_001161, partial [Colwellia sp.]